MKTLVGDGRIDPSLVGSYDSVPTRLPRSVAARVFLDGGVLEGAMPSQEGFRDHVFEFRSEPSAPIGRQALTDTVRWSLESEAAAIVIDMAIPSPDWNPHQKTIKMHFVQYIAHNVESTPGFTGFGVKVINLTQ